jgi:hypothetical protein
MRRRLAFVALAVAVVLAGCGSTTGGTDSGPTATLTPAPVPTTDAEAAGSELDPGAQNGTSRDPWLFAQAHRRALWDTSYTVTMNWSITAGNETLQRADRRVWVARGDDRYRLVQRAERDGYPTMRAAGPEFGIWRTERQGFYRLAGPNHTQYGRLDGVRGREGIDPTDDERIANLLQAFRVEENRLATSRLVRYRFRSTRLVDPLELAVPLRLTDPRNATLHMVVDADGIVRSYRLSYEATYRSRTVRVTRSYLIADLGTTTPTPPDWLAEARNATQRTR